MRDLTRFSDPTFNPNFARDWGHGRPRIEFGRRQRRTRTKKQAATPRASTQRKPAKEASGA